MIIELALLLLMYAYAFPRVCMGRSTFWADVRETYLEILKGTVSGDILETGSVEQTVNGGGKEEPYNSHNRYYGLDWPKYGYTMIGRKRLDNLQSLIEKCLTYNVPGDFIECGVWRGGASIFARLLLDAHHQCDRTVYVADSFAGLPPSLSSRDSRPWDNNPFLEVSLESVKHNFEKFGLSEDTSKIVFVKGFFSQSLPGLREKIEKLSVLRLDGDMYESCADIMANLYEKVSVGGYVIVDDWFTYDCKTAVEDFLKHHRQTVEIVAIDQYAAYFEKRESIVVDDKWYRDFLATKNHQ